MVNKVVNRRSTEVRAGTQGSNPALPSSQVEHTGRIASLNCLGFLFLNTVSGWGGLIFLNFRVLRGPQ